MELAVVTGPHGKGKNKYYQVEYKERVMLIGRDKKLVEDYANENNKIFKAIHRKHKKSRD